MLGQREPYRARGWAYRSAILTVGTMTYARLAYDEPSATGERSRDAAAVSAALHLPRRRTSAQQAVSAAVRPAPSIRFEDQPHDEATPGQAIPEAAARLSTVFHAPSA